MKLFNTKLNLLIFKLLFIIVLTINAHCRICTLKDLRIELIEDIKYNNHLTCLKDIKIFNSVKETEESKNNRIKSRWDTVCAGDFPTEYVLDYLSTYHNINNLVDADGIKTPGDLKNEALLCVMIRTLIANNVFKIRDLDMKHLRAEDIVNKIDCPGNGPPEHKICMVNASGAFYNISAYLPMLKPNVITFANKPEIKQETNNDYTSNINKHKHIDISKHSELAKKLIQEAQNGNINLNNGSAGKDLNNILSSLNPSNINSAFNNDSNLGNNNGFQNNNNSNNNQDNAPENLTKTFTYYKVEDRDTQLVKTSEFKESNLPVLNFDLKDSRTVFAFNMIAFTDSTNKKLKFRLHLNGEPMLSSTSIIEEKSTDSTTAGYIAQVTKDSYSQGTTTFYKSDSNLELNSVKDFKNFTQGAILFEKTNIYASNKQPPFIIKGSNEFDFIKGAELIIKNKNPYATKYIIFYNLPCINPSSDSLLSTMIGGPDKDLEETLSIKSTGSAVSNHGAIVVNLEPNENKKYVLNYKLTSDTESICNVESNDEDSSNSSKDVVLLQGLELKKEAIVSQPQFIPNNDFNADNTGSWTKFFVAQKEYFSKPTSILILFHYNIKVEGEIFSIRLTINGKPARRSLLVNKDHKYASGQGYVLEHLLPNVTYVFDLEFRTTYKEKFTLGNNENIIFFQLIQLP